MMLVMSLACTLAAHDYYFMQFTFYQPFHTSPRVDQCPIHAPSTCTLGLDPCARHSLFGRTDPYTDNLYSSCGLAATLALPLIVLSSQYFFQRGPIWLLYKVEQRNIVSYIGAGSVTHFYIAMFPSNRVGEPPSLDFH